MVKVRGFAALIAMALAVFSCLPVMGATDGTVGLWLFDTMDDVTYAVAGGTGDPPGGETLFDSSGNGLDFVGSDFFGSIALDTDVPSVMGANTYSLNSNQGGAQLLATPSTPLMSRGNTGELTIEFWFKYVAPTPTIAYVASFDGGNPLVTDANDWGIWGDANGDIFFGTGIGTNPLRVGTDFTAGFDAADGNWNQLAFTVDSVGTLTSYFNGTQVQQKLNAAGAAPAAVAGVGKFGFDQNFSFGSHHFKIDELRISDTVLLPGAGTGVGELAWNAQLGPVPPVLPPRGPAFTDQWLRSRDFTISSWDNTPYYGLYTAAGFNTVLGGGPEGIAAGVEDHYLGAFTQLDNKAITDIQIALNQGVSAFMLKDEIAVADIPGAADVAAYIRSVDDQALIYVGLGGSSPGYIDQVVTAIQPDAVIHAWYPFQGATSATDLWDEGLTDLAMVRERTLFHDVALFYYTQAYDLFAAGLGQGRMPTESEMRAEVFSKLSAGVKGLTYYRFQDEISGAVGLVDANGVPGSLYAPVAAVNTEIVNLGQSLRYLTSTDWRFVNGGVSTTPPSVVDWNTLAGNGLIDAISINGPSLDRKDALVGYFTDDLSGEYFMLANTYSGDSLDAAAAAVAFTLTFDSSVNSIWRLNRLTGLVEELALTSNILNLTLPGGTGDLFKFGDGNFPGLAAILGDFNGDGIVDGPDFLAWQRGFGTTYDATDLANWQSNYGSGASPLSAVSGSTAAVPEPTSLLLLLTAITMLGWRKK